MALKFDTSKAHDRFEWSLVDSSKEILVKTVGQSLSTYAIAIFLLPIGICQIEKMISKLWWKSTSSEVDELEQNDKNIWNKVVWVFVVFMIFII